MTTNELRRGNLVHVKGQTGCFTVEVISESIVTLCFDRIFSAHPVEDLQPIQLDESWLIDFGFEQDEQVSYRFHHPKQAFKIDIDDFCFCVGQVWIGRKTKYVHELQNLFFAMYRKELTRKTDAQ